MAAGDILELGKSFSADWLTKLPEEDRATVQAILAKPEAAPAVEYLGQGAKRQSEFSRSMDEVSKADAATRAWHQNLTTWFDENKSYIEAGKRALARRPNGDPDPDPAAGDPVPELPKDLVRASDLDKRLEERDKGVAAFYAAATPLVLKHFQDFNEILNVAELLGDPRLSQLGLQGVYEAKFAEKIAARSQAAQDKIIEARVQERLAVERRNSSRAPYPIPGEVSPLDALEPKTPAGLAVDELAAEYEQLVAKRHGVPA